MLRRGLVDFEDGQRLQVKHPHRMRVALKQQPVLFLAAAHILLGRLPPGSFRRLGHRAAHRRRQPVAFLFEDVIRRARLQALNRRLFANRAGHQDEREIGEFLAHHLERLQTIVIGQLVVRQHQIPRPLVQRLKEFVPTADVAHLRRQFVIGELVAHEHGIGGIVLQMQDAQRRIHGLAGGAVFHRDWVKQSRLSNQPRPQK